jgi:hypothetical protein
MKNRKREICTSGSARDEAGQPPHLLGPRGPLGQPVIIENPTGADGTIGTDRVAWSSE